MNAGVFGAIFHAIEAKLNLDLDRSTPGSTSDAPAYLSVLSSTGEALAYLAGTNITGFANAVSGIPTLLENAITEVATDSSPRTAYSEALLAVAMM
jgi:hypothetical protein